MTVLATFAADEMSAGVIEVQGRPAPPGAPEDGRFATLRLGHAEVVRFDRIVGTIVVGDAEIIDATVIDEKTVALTALSAGRTNIVVLGQEGEVISRFSLTVHAPRPPTAEVYRGTERSVLVCEPACLPSAAETAIAVEP